MISGRLRHEAKSWVGRAGTLKVPASQSNHRQIRTKLGTVPLSGQRRHTPFTLGEGYGQSISKSDLAQKAFVLMPGCVAVAALSG